MKWHFTHEWETISRTYTRPVHEFKVDRMSEVMAERLLFGITNVELRCRVCGDVKIEQCLGKSGPEGKE